MKGIIFNLFERTLTDAHGEDVWDAVLESARVDGAYTAVGTYPHEELHALVAAASDRVGQSSDDLLRWFGKASMPLLAVRYPEFFTAHKTLTTFLPSLNDIIHPEVRKLFPGAYAPQFDVSATDDVVTLAYDSHRSLCFFAEGLVLGAADQFGENVDVAQTECARRGGDRCVLSCRIISRAA